MLYIFGRPKKNHISIHRALIMDSTPLEFTQTDYEDDNVGSLADAVEATIEKFEVDLSGVQVPVATLCGLTNIEADMVVEWASFVAGRKLDKVKVGGSVDMKCFLLPCEDVSRKTLMVRLTRV